MDSYYFVRIRLEVRFYSHVWSLHYWYVVCRELDMWCVAGGDRTKWRLPYTDPPPGRGDSHPGAPGPVIRIRIWIRLRGPDPAPDP